VTRREGKREEILAVAGRVFARHGFRKTTIGDIVREASVARATVYKYFPTKEDVFRAVIHREFGEVLAADEEAMERETTARAKLRAFILKHLEMLRRKVNVYRVTLSALSELYSEADKHGEELAAQALALIGAVLEEGIASGELREMDARATAFTMLVAHKGLFLGALTGYFEPEAEEKQVDQLHDMIFEGLLAGREGA